jgi:glycosyltransferase involved in cell wall biosynthesis
MIYLIDTIGVESGVHYYDISLASQINSSKNVKCKILSNFTSKDSINLINNMYHGSLFKKISSLITSYINLYAFIFKNSPSKNTYVYESFGLRSIDLIFLFPLILYKTTIVDIHDLYPIIGNNPKHAFRNIYYKVFLKRAIIHSEATNLALKKIPYKHDYFQISHVKYTYDKTINHDHIDNTIKNLLQNDKINLLFFGVIRESKGLQELIESLSHANRSLLDKFHLIIAGSDKENVVENIKDRSLEVISTSIYSKRVKDHELSYLFTMSDYSIMPYKEIYQSGVLETSIYFKLPIIASKVGELLNIVRKYPSFGFTYDISSIESLINLLMKVSANKSYVYFCDEDYSNYYRIEKNPDEVVRMTGWLLK